MEYSSSFLEALPKDILCKIMTYTGNDKKESIQEFVKLRVLSKKLCKLVDNKFDVFCNLVTGQKTIDWKNYVAMERRLFSVTKWSAHQKPPQIVNNSCKLYFENHLIAFSKTEAKNDCMPGAETYHRRDGIEFHYRDGFLVVVDPKKPKTIIDFRSKEGFSKDCAPTENFKFSSVVYSGTYVGVYGYDSGIAVLFLKKMNDEHFEKHVISGLEDEIPNENELEKGYRTRITSAEDGLFVREICQGDNVWIAQLLDVEESSKNDKKYKVTLNKSLYEENGSKIQLAFSGLSNEGNGLNDKGDRHPFRVFCISKPIENGFCLYFINNKGKCKSIKRTKIDLPNDKKLIENSVDYEELELNGMEEIRNGFCDEFGRIYLLIREWALEKANYAICSFSEKMSESGKLHIDLLKNSVYVYENPILSQKLFNGEYLIIDQRKNEPSRLLCVTTSNIKDIDNKGDTYHILGGDLPFGHPNSGSIFDKAPPERLVTSRINDNIVHEKGNFIRKILLSSEPKVTVEKIELPLRPQSLAQKIQQVFWKTIVGIAHLFVRFCQITAMILLAKVVGSAGLTILLSTGPLLFCVAPAALLFYAVVIR